jgi:adenylate cyclase
LGRAAESGGAAAQARKRRRRLWIGGPRIAALIILAGFVVLRVFDPAPLETIRLKVFDFYQDFRPRAIPETSPVLIVDIDEESLRRVGQWPWPRHYVAEIVRQLTVANAKVIGIDIIFSEPDRLSGPNVANILPGIDPETKVKLESLPSNDQILAQMSRASRRVVFGQAGLPKPGDYSDRKNQLRGTFQQISGKGAPSPFDFSFKFPGVLRNVPELEEAAAGIGMLNVVPERDGIVRRVPAFFGIDNKLFPSLSVEMFRLAAGRSGLLAKSDVGGVSEIRLSRTLIVPSDTRGRMWPYFSRHDPSKYVSAVELLTGQVPKERIEGKMVLIGTSATGLLDIKPVPTASSMPGVEVHAQLIESLLSGSFLKRPAVLKSVEISVLVAAGLFVIVFVPWVGALWSFVIGVVGAAATVGTSWYLFDQHLILFGVAYPVGAALLLYIILTLTSFIREEAQRRQTRDAFSKYMSPAMVQQVVENPELLTLGGAKRDMTLLFCDVRGFTTISELFDAEGLTELINKLLTPLTDVILKYRGTVDKYMGDCIMAFWNAPLDEPDHVRDGCRAALEMVAAMGPLNRHLKDEADAAGRPHVALKVGLGVNTGEAVVGNMGTAQRMDYSVLGDTVNTASRLEGQSKTYGVDIVIGPETAKRVSEFAVLELDRIQVKGKTVGLNIFALLGDETLAGDGAFAALKQAQEAMLAAYRGQRWDDARARIVDARAKGAVFKLDDLYDLYEFRIETYEEHPPPPDWDGTFVATTK